MCTSILYQTAYFTRQRTLPDSVLYHTTFHYRQVPDCTVADYTLPDEPTLPDIQTNTIQWVVFGSDLLSLVGIVPTENLILFFFFNTTRLRN